MRTVFRVLMMSVLACVLLAAALAWVATDVMFNAWPEVTVQMDDEVMRWTAQAATDMLWWVLGLTVAMLVLVLIVPVVLLLGLALPLLLALVSAGGALAVAVLAVALVLSPLWLLLLALWRALRPRSVPVSTAVA